MPSTRVKVYAAFVAVFLLGTAAGGALTYARMRSDYLSLSRDESGELRERRRLGALGRELGLSDAQRDRVRQILRHYRPLRKELLQTAFERCGGPLREQRAQIDSEIRALLDPAQRERFDAIAAAERERAPFASRGE